MGFINKDTLTVDAILTKKGIDYLRTAVFGQNQNAEHVITKFALSDDEIDYGLWDTTPSGSNFVKPYGQVIDNQPLTEPMVTNNENMRYFLFKDGIVFDTAPEPADVTPPITSFNMFRGRKKEFSLFRGGSPKSLYQGRTTEKQKQEQKQTSKRDTGERQQGRRRDGK
jgi:hypothetical protein